jgi:hypothetical protein
MCQFRHQRISLADSHGKAKLTVDTALFSES